MLGLLGAKLLSPGRVPGPGRPIKHHSVVFIKVSNTSMNPLISMLHYVEIFSYLTIDYADKLENLAKA